MVWENLKKYGEAEVCVIHKGWFCDMLAIRPVSNGIKVAYIDCDLAKGTKEAIKGIVPSLVDDGRIFSQDYHIKPVQKLLKDPVFWASIDL